MNKGTLTTLDFVISVLREHEKEMTLLSDKLEDVLSRVPSENIEKGMSEVHTVLKDIKERISTLDQKTINSNVSSIESLLEKLMKQVAIQNQSLSLLVETMRNYPTKRELEELKASISSFNSLIQSITSKGGSKEPRY